MKGRITTKYPQRTVVGVVEAMDWPPKQVQMNAFYLLTLGDVPMQNVLSSSSTGWAHLVQWVWIIPGDDLSANQRGRNRGNRFRTIWQMKQELVYGLYPYFTEKKTWSAVQTGDTQITYTGTSLNPVETFYWTRPKFIPNKLIETSGIAYGAAQVFIGDFGDVITS